MITPLDWIATVDLPARWRGRNRFVVLEAGGEHASLIDAWQALWRADPARCAELHVIVVGANASSLTASTPNLTPNIHRHAFDDGALVALVLPMALDDALAELVAQVDVFHVARPATDAAAMDRRAFKGFARLAAAGATMVVDHASAHWRASLRSAGFQLDDRGVATFEARDSRRGRVSHASPMPSAARPRALVIGAGLAGCATAWALAERGWHSVLFDAHDHIAAEASGNPAGLFHGIFNRQDGRHARFNRAAALEATKAVRLAIDKYGANGATDGVLRLGTGTSVYEMRADMEALGLRAEYIEALDPARMSEMAGLAIDRAGWFYPGGGWVDPAALARSFVARAGERVRLRLGGAVASLRRGDATWQLIDANGAVMDEAATVVLANAFDALRLLSTVGRGLSDPAFPIDWPLMKVRGQLSVMRTSASPHVAAPRRPITGAGYVMAVDRHHVLFGATAQPNDDDASVRIDDHRANLERLDSGLAGWRAIGGTRNSREGPGILDIDLHTLEGRTAWRCVAADRMPVIGAVPLRSIDTDHGPGLAISVDPRRDQHLSRPALELTNRFEQPRAVPREPGLFVYTALGSRGITWATLGAQTLAALISGAPCPIEATLLDAVDPARFVSRRVRRGG